MSRTALAAAVVLVAVVGVGLLFVGGSAPGGTGSPAPGAGDATTTTDAGSPGTERGTEAGSGTPTGSDGNPPGGSDDPTTTASSSYAFTIERIEKCGSTCRDVTARLANAGGEIRRDVRAETKVYADGDLLWTGNETVGTLRPGEAHTSTKRVDVGIVGGMKIQNNDGYVTIVTVVRSASGTTRFEDRRKVA